MNQAILISIIFAAAVARLLLVLLTRRDRESAHKTIGICAAALGVADRTVIRYMDELEWEGKVEQVGNTGRNVAYRLKS